ncbi:MAG: ABC transporter substrate-binding protein [Tagaea sp.]|nr:ABC transporter substrate-binding protein [Tagaea sp.]
MTDSFDAFRRAAASVAFVIAVICHSGPALAQTAPRVDTIEPGQLTVLYSPSAPPTSFIQNGQPTGMAIDLVTEAARRIGLRPVFRAQADLAGAIPAVSNRQYDIAAIGLMRTPEREAVVDFTNPWFYGWFPLVADKSRAIKSYQDLNGKIVGVVRGSIQEKYMQDNHPNIRLMGFPTEVAMIGSANAGSIDALLMGSAQVEETQRRFPNLETIARTPTPYPNAFPVRKGNATLKTALNDALEGMMRDGTYVRIFDKWHPGNALPDPLYRDFPVLGQQRQPGVPGPR